MSAQTITPYDMHKQPSLQEIPVREGVILRPLEDVDAPKIIEALDADPMIRDRVTVAAHMRTEKDVKQEVIRYKSNPDRMRYAIVENGVCVGLMSLWRDDGYISGRADPLTLGCGFFLNPAARGRGLATDSLKALLEAAHACLPVNRFIAFCEDDNSGSLAVLRSVGMESTPKTYQEPVNGWTERLYEKKVANGKD